MAVWALVDLVDWLIENGYGKEAARMGELLTEALSKNVVTQEVAHARAL